MKNHGILILIGTLLTACASKSDALKQKYPYASLTPDHGILNEDDLWISEQLARPVPFSQNSYAYPYWQCLPIATMQASCKNTGDKDDEGRSPLAELELDFKSQDHVEQYIGRRAIPRSDCDEIISRWKALARGQTYACIAGSYVAQVQQQRTWEYDRFKTKKGCVSYFEDYCSGDYWRKKALRQKRGIEVTHEQTFCQTSCNPSFWIHPSI